MKLFILWGNLITQSISSGLPSDAVGVRPLCGGPFLLPRDSWVRPAQCEEEIAQCIPPQAPSLSHTQCPFVPVAPTPRGMARAGWRPSPGSRWAPSSFLLQQLCRMSLPGGRGVTSRTGGLRKACTVLSLGLGGTEGGRLFPPVVKEGGLRVSRGHPVGLAKAVGTAERAQSWELSH